MFSCKPAAWPSWLKAAVPVYLLAVYKAHRIRATFGSFWSKINQRRKFYQWNSLFFAVLLQALLLGSFTLTVAQGLSSRTHPVVLGLFFLSLMGLNVYILLRSAHVVEAKILTETQSTISDDIMNLITAVRSQRHDFLHHIQVISSLYHTGNMEALGQYLSQVTVDVSRLNNLLKITSPFIAALLNIKLCQAEAKGVRLDVEVEGQVFGSSTRDYDLARVLGNLIDNAIEAVETKEPPDKWVTVVIRGRGPFLVFSITNPGEISPQLRSEIFKSGFTTKGNQHLGLGLRICQDLTKKLHGRLECRSWPEGQVTFTLTLPRNE